MAMIELVRKSFADESRIRWIAGLGLALLMCASTAAAPTPVPTPIPVPGPIPIPIPPPSIYLVTYDEELMGGNISGSLNGTPFSNSYLFLEFKGNLRSVVPFSVTGASGWVITAGTATFEILDAAFNKVGSGTFLSGARIYVSVDNTNGGIGFGSFSIPRGQPGFPGGQALYPGAVLVPSSSNPNVTKYELKTDTFFSDYQLGCVGFPGTCKPGLPLPTTAGTLLLDQITVGPGYFSTTVTHVVVPLPRLTVNVALGVAAAAPAGGTPLNHFQVQGTFSTDASQGHFDPLTEPVTLQLAQYRVTIPPGSFTGSDPAGYTFKGEIDGVDLGVSLRPGNGTDYAFEVDGAGKGVPPLPDALFFKLTLGSHMGRAMVTATRPESYR